MTPTSLFFLSLLPLLLAAPPLVRDLDLDCSSKSDPCAQAVFLKDGFARRSIHTFFELKGSRGKAGTPTFEIVDSDHDDIITNVTFGVPPPPLPDNDNVVYPTTVTFNGFPGRVTLKVLLEDDSGVIHTFRHVFQVIGLVLYKKQGDKPQILTGLNPDPLVVQQLEDGAYGATVKVTYFRGSITTTPVELDKLRLVVEKNSDVLPWDPDECPIAADASSLGSRCAMAFSIDFATFSVRIAPDKEIPASVRVQFEWVGIKDYEGSQAGESGITSASAGEEPVVLTNDIITSALIEKPTGSGDTRLTSPASLAGWKIGVIAIICVLLVVAALTLVCCCFCARKKKESPKKPEPDVAGVKNKFQEIGFLRPLAQLRRGDHDFDEDDQCYVEEPLTPNDSEVLMLGNDSNEHVTRKSGEGHIEGIIPMDRLNEDKSVERLVLPPGVVRGVELESSTEGASAFEYGPHSGENDVTSYGRGMTSTSRDEYKKSREYGSRERPARASRSSERERSREQDYSRNSPERIRSRQRDRARIRELDREIEQERSARERSQEQRRPQSSVEEFPETGPVIDDRSSGARMSKSRGGVGAAINRIRQLDLLNGPASRGLVGRNGEPIQNNNGEDVLGAEGGDIAGSAMS